MGASSTRGSDEALEGQFPEARAGLCRIATGEFPTEPPPLTASGDDRQGAGLGSQRDPSLLADVVAVDLDREGAGDALLGL